MKPILFAVFAIFFYAAQNVVIQRKLTTVSPLANMAFFYVGVLALTGTALLVTKTGGTQTVMPQGSQWLWLGLCALMLFAADFFYFSAYSAGAKLVTLTTLAVLLPVFASLITWATGGDPELSASKVLGWLLAAVAVWLVAK